ncbi:hypothetical protein OsI_00414 [Oryza sativa Indica Group]|uniref:very-long-chain (3R)-3-hydroxyacyl-CoA dehydratase n=1 Tax=Oryza sativa subsp. indica TaxID=39946 RepID=B8ADA9_ORYSI|nr:hypothetical protein OsI_00414 [Oryza sativa Indica Group]
MAADGSTVRRLYLSIYNWVAFIGWAQVLCYMTLALLDKGHEAVYAAIERPLLFTQTAAILEVLVFPSSLPLFIRENWRLRVVPYLFHHMIAQRKKALSKAKTT